jgi:MFS family permease
MNKKYFYYSVLFGAIGLVASDTFIPSIPSIAKSFGVDVAVIQATVSIFLLGFCLARFGIAILSDGLGRKPMLTICFCLLVIGSVLCFSAPSVYYFNAGRFLQGIGAGGSNVLARVIIRDTTDNRNLARCNSLYSMFAVTLMVSAPLLGSVLQTYFNWHAVFIFITVLSVLALFLSSLRYQETNEYKDISRLKPQEIQSSLIALFKGHGCIQYAGLLFASFGLMTAWLTAGSVILQERMHLTYIEFGCCALCVGSFYFVASWLSSKHVTRVGERKLIGCGVGLLVLPPIILLGAVMFHSLWLLTLLVVFSVAAGFFATGLIIPNAYSMGVKSFRNIAGMAGAFFGFSQMLGGSVYSLFIAGSNNHSLIPLWVTMAVTLMITTIAFVCLPCYS